MAKNQSIQNNFSAGEIGEYLEGRSDTNEYRSGARKMLNVLTDEEGGFYNRPGTIYYGHGSATLGNITKTKFIKFSVSSRDYTIMLNPTKVSGNLSANVKCIDENGTSITVTTSLTYIFYKQSITDTSDTAITADEYSLNYVQIGNSIVVVSNCGLYMPLQIDITVDPTTGYATEIVLKRWMDIALGEFGQSRKEPFRAPNTDPDIRFTIADLSAGAWTSIQVNTTDSIGAPISYFAAGTSWIGALFKITKDDGVGTLSTGVYYVSAYTSVSQVTMTFLDVPLPAGTTAGVTDNWEISEFNQIHGFPKVLSGFEQRLIFMNNFARPNYMWGSATQNITLLMINMLIQDLGATTDQSGLGYFGEQIVTDPFSYGIVANESIDIRWANSGEELHIGTSNAEFSARGGSDSIISRTYISIRKHSNTGGAYFRSISIGDTSLFISKNFKKVHLFKKDPQTQTLTAIDLNVLNQDIIYNLIGDYDLDGYRVYQECQIVSSAVQRDSNTVWFVVAPQQALISLKININTKQAAWHKHDLGRDEDSLSAPVLVYDVTTMKNPSTRNDRLFLSVKRVYDSVTSDYGIEYTSDRFFKNVTNGSTFKDFMVMSDCALIAATPITVDFGDGTWGILGFGHVDNQRVSVVINNRFYLGEYDVDSSGRIVIDDRPELLGQSIDPVIAGFSYTSEVRTLPPDFGAQAGTSQGLLANLFEIIIRYINSGNFYYGTDDEYMYEARVEKQTFPVSADAKGLTISSGVEEFKPEGSPERDHEIIIRQTKPLPLHILYIVSRGTVNEG